MGFGKRNLDEVLTTLTASPVHVLVSLPNQSASPAAKAASAALPAKPESFAIAKSGNSIAIVGRDQVGAMYGCLELAERITNKGAAALDIRKPITQSPAVEFRAVNQFLTLPYKETDEDWWFLQDDYWTGFLDQLARARINWLDLHGMFDIKSTGFPNIYPYFITSEKFPEVGVDPAVAKRHLDMLNKIISMAKSRGIRVALMSYSAGWNGKGLRKPSHDPTEDNLAAYTREVVAKMIRSCPDLAMIGFRIGESGMKEDFYARSYIPAIKESGRPIDLYTRTWGAKKEAILDIARQFPGRLYIEVKYNGEQFGPPYIIEGGRARGGRDYFYQDYFSYPHNYKVIFQLRANGTHRVFPWGSPELAARANRCSLMGGAIGVSVEPMDAYYPKYDFRHKDDSPSKWYKWQYQRDWFWYQVWGRTAYDLSLGMIDTWYCDMFGRRFGKNVAGQLNMAVESASRILPDAITSYCLGWDQRQHAPELETGGSLKQWASKSSMDTTNVMYPKDFADKLVHGYASAKATPFDMADRIQAESIKTRDLADSIRSKPGAQSPELKDLTTELIALSYLGEYYACKLKAASLFAVMTASSDPTLEPRISSELKNARQAWDHLAAIGDENYKPFVEELRMKTESFTWSEEGKKLDQDIKDLDEAVASIKASGKIGHAPTIDLIARGPWISDIKADIISSGSQSKTLYISAMITSSTPVKDVILLTKPFPSEDQWTEIPMTLTAGSYTAQAVSTPEGLIWCIEATDKSGKGTIYPDFRNETPYKIIEPWETASPENK